MEEQNKITVKELNETQMSNIPDKEFKVIIINIDNGLEKIDELRTLTKR